MPDCGVKQLIVRQRRSRLQVLKDQLIFSSIGELAYDQTDMIIRRRHWRGRQRIVIHLRTWATGSTWWRLKDTLVKFALF
jgi:hypothetical protein